MQCEKANIIQNEMIAPDIYRMELKCAFAQEVKPGQFVQVEVPGFFLRRPISVSEVWDDHMVLIYKKVGQGTKCMSSLEARGTVDLFGPLGTGFPIVDEDVVLIGGGVGVPPLVETAKQYLNNHHAVHVVLGFNTKEQIFLEERFKKLGCSVIIATMDGSEGIHGTVMDALKEEHLEDVFVEACGPMPMLKAVAAQCHGYISLEARMACGIGACMGCVVKSSDGSSVRVCKEGPVFEIGKVVL